MTRASWPRASTSWRSGSALAPGHGGVHGAPVRHAGDASDEHEHPEQHQLSRRPHRAEPSEGAAPGAMSGTPIEDALQQLESLQRIQRTREQIAELRQELT